jgi:hypothetical protein
MYFFIFVNSYRNISTLKNRLKLLRLFQQKDQVLLWSI